MAIDTAAGVRTVSALTTTDTTDQSPTPHPVEGARRQANRHLDRLLSPGKDPTDPSGRAWLAPIEVPAEVRARVAEMVEAYRQHQLVRPEVAQFLLYGAVREPGRAPADYDVELIHRYRGELADLVASVNTANAALSALR